MRFFNSAAEEKLIAIRARALGNDKMIKMRVSKLEADAILSNINHATFKKGKRKHWHTGVNQNGEPQASWHSMCWLFVWATTGQQSGETKSQAQQAFDDIFHASYDSQSLQLPLEKARKDRYL